MNAEALIMELKSLGLGKVLQPVHIQPLAGDVTDFNGNPFVQQMFKKGIKTKFLEISTGAQVLQCLRQNFRPLAGAAEQPDPFPIGLLRGQIVREAGEKSFGFIVLD
jgi:hypothetical protein